MTALPLPPAPAKGIAGLFQGVGFFLRGFKLVMPGGGLFRYALGLIAVSLTLLVVMAVIAWFVLDALLHAWLADWLSGWGSVAVRIILVLLAIVLAWLLLGPVNALLGPMFMDPLCRRVRERYGHPVPPNVSTAERFADSVVQASKNAATSLLIDLPLFVLMLFTGVGALVAIPVRAVNNGLDLMEYPHAYRGMARRERFAWFRANFWGIAGLGLAAAACSLVPVVNLLVTPASVAGATVLDLSVGSAPRSES
jgi:CysZ protein